MVRGWTATTIALLALASVVSAGEFSATVNTDMRGKSASYPIYVKGRCYCTVQEDGGQSIRILVDMERNITTVIVAAEKAYIEMPTDGLRSKANDPIQAVLHVPKELVERIVGKETIEGYECEKREYTFNDKLCQVVWFSTELGLPLKIEQHAAAVRTFKITGFKQGPVDAALFSVPDGFKKMEEPPKRTPKPTPEEKPKPSIEGTAYGRAPWGGRLAQGAEARIHFDQNTEPAILVVNDSSEGKAQATVTFFLHGERLVGSTHTVELLAMGRKEVGKKRLDRDANEARITIQEGTCFVMVRQNEKMGTDKFDLSYLRAPMQRTVMLRPNQPARIALMGDCVDGPASEVQIRLMTPGNPLDYTVTLKNGEFWRRPVDVSEKVSRLEAIVKSGAVRLEVIQGSRAKPLPAFVAGQEKKMGGTIFGAINSDDVEWMKAALAAGLSIDHQFGRNPMIKLVASKASPEMLAMLLDRGVDVVKIEKGGLSLLGAAATNPRYWRENILLLIEKGADVKFKNKFGFTPLHYATTSAGGSRPEVIGSARLLLEKGADVNAPLKAGDTALHKAVDASDLALVKLLVNYGADVNAKGRKGRTPMSRAVEIDNLEIIGALKEAPAK